MIVGPLQLVIAARLLTIGLLYSGLLQFLAVSNHVVLGTNLLISGFELSILYSLNQQLTKYAGGLLPETGGEKQTSA